LFFNVGTLRISELGERINHPAASAMVDSGVALGIGWLELAFAPGRIS